MADLPSVKRDIQVPADLVTVWQMLTDTRLISDWMGGKVELDPRPGGDITLSPEDGPTVWGTVEEAVEPERIQWSWRTDEGLPSLVEIELSPGDDTGFTHVTVRESMLPWRISGPDGDTDWPQASVAGVSPSASIG